MDANDAKTKSAGKTIMWSNRFIGHSELLVAPVKSAKVARLDITLHRAYPENYEVVRITVEPVAETKKRKAK